jgi:FMN-dependent NADH-azoreductase
MKKVLVINSSARALRSQSRKLTEVFIDHWKSAHTGAIINFRELGNADVPHINETWIAAAFKPAAERSAAEIEALKTSDTYIAELKEADVIVVGSPMYNWSVPSALKAYIDQVVRINETFSINRTDVQNPYVGLLENKTLFLLLSRGEQEYEKGGYNQHLDYQGTYLKTVFNVMGVSNIHVVAVSGASYRGESFNRAIDITYQNLKDLIEVEANRK